MDGSCSIVTWNSATHSGPFGHPVSKILFHVPTLLRVDHTISLSPSDIIYSRLRSLHLLCLAKYNFFLLKTNRRHSPNMAREISGWTWLVDRWQNTATPPDISHAHEPQGTARLPRYAQKVNLLDAFSACLAYSEMKYPIFAMHTCLQIS